MLRSVRDASPVYSHGENSVHGSHLLFFFFISRINAAGCLRGNLMSPSAMAVL